MNVLPSIRKRMPGCAYVEHRAIGSRRAAPQGAACATLDAAPRLSVPVRGLTRLSGPNEIDSFQSWRHSKLYIPSTPNNSNETHTFMCLGRTGRFGQR